MRNPMMRSCPERASMYGTSVSLQCCSWHTATSLLFASSCTGTTKLPQLKNCSFSNGGISPGAWLERFIRTALPFLPETQQEKLQFTCRRSVATKVKEVSCAQGTAAAAQHILPKTEPPGLSYKAITLGTLGQNASHASSGTKMLQDLMLHAFQ